MRPRILSIVPVVVAFVGDLAWAETPTERLRTFFIEASAIVREANPEPGPPESRATLRALVNDVFDFRAAAARALGPEWLGRTPGEQEEFVRLFAGLVERGYAAMLGPKAGGGGLAFTFVGEWVRGDSATVTTIMLTRSGSELPVDFQLSRHGTRWAVQDVKVNGVSLVGNYRAQFRRVMQASSYRDLVGQLRDKVLDAPRSVTAPEAPPARPGAARTAADDERVPDTYRVADDPPLVAPTRAEPGDLTPSREPGELRALAAAPGPDSATTTTPADRVRYWVQLGAFRSTSAASRLADRLRQRLPNVSTTSTGLTAQDSMPLARVRVGPFTERAHAAATLKELEKSGYRGFVVAEMRER
jgi:phospholipid transport system substrate-binding protein